MSWATVADVQTAIGAADVKQYTPQGGDFALAMQAHLDSAAATITARLTEAGWSVPIAGLTTTAAAWLKAAQIAIALERAQLARGGSIESGQESNVVRAARQYHNALERIAAGSPLADMTRPIATFEAIVDDPAKVSPYDLSAGYRSW